LCGGPAGAGVAFAGVAGRVSVTAGQPGLAGMACRWFPGRLPPSAGNGRGVLAGSADLVEQPEVVAQSGEEEFAGDGGQAAHGEPAQPDAVFEAGMQVFDVGGAAPIEGASSGGAQPPVVGLGGCGVFGRGAFGGIAARVEVHGVPLAGRDEQASAGCADVFLAVVAS